MLATRIVALAICLTSILALSTALLHPRSSQASYTPRSRHSVRSSAVYLNDFTSPSTAQAATRVHLPPPFADRESYAGYVTVNETCGSNIFYWQENTEHTAARDVAPIDLLYTLHPRNHSLCVIVPCLV